MHVFGLQSISRQWKSPQRTRKHFALRYGGSGGYHHSRRHLNASGGALPVDAFFRDLDNETAAELKATTRLADGVVKVRQSFEGVVAAKICQTLTFARVKVILENFPK